MGEHLLCTQGVRGSNPLVSTNPHQDCVSAVAPSSELTEKAEAHPLHGAMQPFLLSKQIGGCTQATVRIYRWWLERFTVSVPETNPLAVHGFFADLQAPT